MTKKKDKGEKGKASGSEAAAKNIAPEKPKTEGTAHIVTAGEATSKGAVESAPAKHDKLDDEFYLQELRRLQIELVKLQEWVKANGLKMVVIFEGRDAAGKGGTIKRITESLNPRVCRVVALPAPNDREKNQWYFQDRKSVV